MPGVSPAQGMGQVRHGAEHAPCLVPDLPRACRTNPGRNVDHAPIFSPWNMSHTQHALKRIFKQQR